MRSVLILLGVLAILPVVASEPGQALGPEDWIFTLPGLEASEYLGPTPACNYNLEYDPLVCDEWQGGAAVDTSGAPFILNKKPVPTGDLCGREILYRQEIYRLDPTTGNRQLIAYLADRCANPALDQVDRWGWMLNYKQGQLGLYPDAKFLFDASRGVLFLTMRSGCATCNVQGSVDRIIRFSGFATTFDVLQSFTPSANAVGFRVPYMPEGMNGADYFDTYWGNLATVGDWSQAQGLECGYPSTAPSVGDYLEVADTLPPPGPGHGYYYVTAARYMGETRYGRKTTNGRLTGRDPALLPTCAILEERQ